MSHQEYEKLIRQRAMASFEQFSRELGREIEQRGLTEEELLDEVKRARQEVYEERYGRRDS